MRAQPYQDKAEHLLKKAFGSDLVQQEWPIWKGASDDWAKKMTYAPRLDIAVGPFNLTSENKEHDIQKILAKSQHSLIKKIIDEASRQNPDNFILNKNPRCLLAIEIEFSGSSKHVLGDYTNASMIGLIGIVISSPKTQSKIARVGQYARKLQNLEKGPTGLFSNTVHFQDQEFINIIKKYI